MFKIRVASVALALITAGGVAASPAVAASATSTATAQAININIAGSAPHATSPQTVSNDGTGSTAPVSKSVAITNDAIVLSSGTPNPELGQAGTDGSSLACAGMDALAITVAADGKSCTSGNGFSIISLNVAVATVLQNALAPLSCGGIFLRGRALLSYAYSDGVDAPTGGATWSSPTIAVCNPVGDTICNNPVLPLSTTPNTDLMAQIISTLSGVGGTTCSEIVDALRSVQDQVSLIWNYQTKNADGSFQVSALHFSTVTDSTNFDFAISSVGPNSIATVDTALMSPEVVGGLLAAVALGAFAAWSIRRRRNTAASSA
jgi:hypothetical protein